MPNSQFFKTFLTHLIEENITFFAEFEAFFRIAGKLPHYRQFIIPLYQFLGGNQNPSFSIPMTFLITDYVFHQLPPQLLCNFLLENDKNPFTPYVSLSLAWTSLCIPIVLYKLYKLENNSNQINREEPIQEWEQPQVMGLKSKPKNRYKFSIFAQQPCVIDDAEMLTSSFGKSAVRRMKA